MASKSIILSSLALLGPVAGHVGHKSCGFHDRTEAEASREARLTEETLQRRYGSKMKANAVGGEIKVYLHEIRNTNGDGVLTQAMVDDQMDVLNDAFADGGWTFTLQEWDITVNDDWFNMAPEADSELNAKAALRKGTGADLNFYTAGVSDGLLGWATFPTDYASSGLYDGVVCHVGTLPGGSFDKYNLGDTGTHEVGHWMGLYHTFQGGCGGSGDLVADTPEVAGPNFGCPGPVDSCPADGQGNDMTENFMDYVDDACMDSFTTGQFNRAQELWDAFRYDTAPPPSTGGVSFPETDIVKEASCEHYANMDDAGGLAVLGGQKRMKDGRLFFSIDVEVTKNRLKNGKSDINLAVLDDMTPQYLSSADLYQGSNVVKIDYESLEFSRRQKFTLDFDLSTRSTGVDDLGAPNSYVEVQITELKGDTAVVQECVRFKVNTKASAPA